MKKKRILTVHKASFFSKQFMQYTGRKRVPRKEKKRLNRSILSLMDSFRQGIITKNMFSTLDDLASKTP